MAARLSPILRRHANARDAAFLQGFFKTGPGEYGEGDRFLGIRVPVLRGLARTHQHLPLRDVDALLRSPWHEERLLALFILVRQAGRADDRARARIRDLYLRRARYVNNWDLVDASAGRILGPFASAQRGALLWRLIRSPLVWKRRMAVIATFPLIARGRVGESLKVARLLLDDDHDLIHKATGWMLRETGKRDRAALEGFLARHAARMPRTMLRYAIERLPPAARARYMKAPGRRRRS